MLAEESARRLIEIEKMMKSWLPKLEKLEKEDPFCFNLAEEFRRVLK